MHQSPRSESGSCTCPGEHAGIPHGAADDLTWLLHRVAQLFRDSLGEGVKAAGLADVRDWMVLTALADGVDRSQLEIARELGVDKTTLVAIIDRLEKQGYVMRTLDPRDRRVRVPRTTESGRALQAALVKKRETAEEWLFDGLDDSDRANLKAALLHIALTGACANGTVPVCTVMIDNG